MSADLEWDDIIEDEPEVDELDAEIALATFNLARLKAVKALRGMAQACADVAASVRALSDRHVLNSEVIDE